MATEIPTKSAHHKSATAAQSGPFGAAAELAVAIVKPLASLKLTVFLLVLSVLTVWIATLDQTRIDIWELKAKHFHNLLVYVPFQTLFAPAWFPTLQDIPGGFYIPSGITLIFAMLINLTAAHSLRFRIQAKGTRLIAGFMAAAFTAAITWFVIFAGQGADGLVSHPVSFWASLRMSLQIGLLALSIAAFSGMFLLPKEQRVEKQLCGIFGLIGLGVLGFTLYMGDRFVGDSGMRILWQLLQSTVAASCGLVACLALFRRKAGIVLLHLGVAGLLLNEIYVTVTNEEQQMVIVEGETTSQALDIRTYEMAIMDRSDPEFDKVVVVPVSKLNSAAVISDEDLPFDIECLAYYPNSDLVDIQPGQQGRATAGLGTTVNAVEATRITGTELEEKSNAPAAYVQLLDKKNGNPLGVYLIGLLPYRSGFVDTVSVDDKPYQIGLRYKHVYKPYAVTLNDVNRSNYLGTKIPQSYSSDIVLKDFERNASTTQKIWMNNPLRYGGETFYQSSYDASGPKEATTLQVVKNEGWMIPYVCCMFVVVGLVHQFGTTLLGFLKKQQSKIQSIVRVDPVTNEQRIANSADQPPPVKRTSWWPAIVLLVLFGGYVAMELAKAVDGTEEVVVENGSTPATPMRLDLLGKLPVTYGGRVQPFDSLARNLARQLGKRETVNYRKQKRPAVQWLADTIFEADGFADNYQFLRIEDPNVRQALSLPDRQGFKYSWSELQKSEKELVRLLQEASQLEPEQRSPLQLRLNEVYSKMAKVIEVKRAMTDSSVFPSDGNLIERLADAAQAASLTDVPLAVATDDPSEPWISLANALNRQWLAELADELGVTNIQALAARIVDVKMIQPVRDNLVREELANRLVNDDEAMKKLSELFGEDSQAKILDKLLDENEFAKVPEDVYQVSMQAVTDDLTPKIERGRKILEGKVAGNLTAINGKSNSEIIPVKGIGLDLLKQIEPTYRAGDSETFNRVLGDYLAEIQQLAPSGWRPVGIQIEPIYNKFSPFYLAMVIYLAAFLVGAISWIGWTKSLNRAAFSLIMLAVGVQIAGIVARIVISGRPPVTNLYSSFVFVSAAAIVFILIAEKITRLGVGNIMASLLGFLSLMWAWSMSIGDGDTFTVLQAVLDTQFWLSTHVVCISLGYCSTIAAGFLAIAFVFTALITKQLNKDTRRLFGNVIYGVVCFGLLFSFFGTVLGGLWADDSWGRFWGWDPKENGALMIVLWNAVVLHSRMAGLIRERGLAALAIFGNIVTVWSWEAVNQMGVGLHAYGGSEGNRMTYVGLFWLVNLALVGVALIPTKFWRSYAD